MKNKIFLALIVMFALSFPVAYVLAADFLPNKPDISGNVVVTGDQEYRNLYVGGGSVIVNQNILGDLFSIGSSVNIAGETEEDLLVAGGSVNVISPVLEDARIAGGNVTVNTAIGGDLLVAGATVVLGADASVGGDLWVAGSIINISGPVAGDVKIKGVEVLIDGVITGTLEVKAGKKLTFGKNSQVLGSIIYSGPNEPIIEQGAVVGSIQNTYVAKEKKEYDAFPFVSVVGILSILFAASMFYLIFRNKLLLFVSAPGNRFWHNLGVGALSFIVFPVASLLLIVSVIGMYVGFAALIWFILALMASAILSIVFLGLRAHKYLHKKEFFRIKSADFSYKTILLGVLVWVLISLIPVIGALTLFVLCLASFGSLVSTIRTRITS